MLEYGYVKIVSGNDKGRIARYIKDDDTGKKAIISFGYQIDELPYSTYKKVSHISLTNSFYKEDLLERYYDIIDDLKAIDIRGHKKIKKYSQEHNDLITECDLVRNLLREYFHISNLNNEEKQKNIIIFSSFKDTLWCNDFVLDLLNKKFNVGIINHELWNNDNLVEKALEKSNNFIFILSKNSKDENWFKTEYEHLKRIINKKVVNLICVKSDTSSLPSYIEDYYDLKEVFNDTYNETFSKMITEIEYK